MRVRVLLAGAAATLLLAGLGVAGAAPASAASADPAATTLPCGSDTNGANDLTITGAVGDTFTFATTPFNYACGLSSTATTLGATTYVGYGGIVTVTGTNDFGVETVGLAGSTATFTIVGSGSFTISHGFTLFTDHSSTITIRLPGDAPAAAAIPAWVQAYGRFSQDATCQDGYGQSWQSWAEKVTGGWVCTRSIPSLG